MFFKDINSWSERKLFWIRALFWSLYFVAATVVPITIVICNYGGKAQAEGGTFYTLPMFWLIFSIIVLTVGVKKLISVVNDFDDQTRKDQIIKFSIQMLVALIIPIVAIVVLYQLSVNWELARNTIIGVIISYSVGIVIEYTCCKSLDVAKRIKREAKEKIAVDEAAASLKK